MFLWHTQKTNNHFHVGDQTWLCSVRDSGHDIFQMLWCSRETNNKQGGSHREEGNAISLSRHRITVSDRGSNQVTLRPFRNVRNNNLHVKVHGCRSVALFVPSHGARRHGITESEPHETSWAEFRPWGPQTSRADAIPECQQIDLHKHHMKMDQKRPCHHLSSVPSSRAISVIVGI